MGTCKMAPTGDHGVVDASLSVYGVKGLKVADLSVCPRLPADSQRQLRESGNDDWRKTADMFIQELGIRKR